jgi:hypothetical protein
MSESFVKKADGKDKIIRALGALLILFSAFIFFNTINPELLKVRFEPAGVSVKADDLNIKDMTCNDYKEDFREEMSDYSKILNQSGFSAVPVYGDVSNCEKQADALVEANSEKGIECEIKRCRVFIFKDNNLCAFDRPSNSSIFGFKCEEKKEGE